MAFKIITDSATDLPKEIIDKYQLHVIPTPVTIDGTDYFDGKTIFPEDFYRIQAQGTDIKTYHINQYMFRENFEPYAKAGDEVLYMCFSTGIAGTFNAANLAKEELLEEYPEFALTIIDTKCASLGFGLAVEKILRMQANGAPKDLIIEAAQFFCEHMEHIVTVETLEYLRKGGRIGLIPSVLGAMLQLKPIISCNEDGVYYTAAKARGRKRSLDQAVALAQAFAGQGEYNLAIAHGGAEAEAGQLAEQAKTLFPKAREIFRGQISPALVVHTGPGLLGIGVQRILD